VGNFGQWAAKDVVSCEKARGGANNR